MKKLLSLLLACVLLCGCAQNNAPADVTTTTADNVTEESDNRFENYDFSAYSAEIKYNENPDIASKTMPEGYATVSWIAPKETKDLVIDGTRYSDEILVVRILNDDRELGLSVTGDPELDEALNEKHDNDFFTKNNVKVATAEVLYSIYGNLNTGDTINISQLLACYGVNLKTGNEYLIVLRETIVQEEYYYPPLNGIHSIFEIKDDFTVYSESPLTVCSRYDGLSLVDTAHDLKVALEENLE